jgi:predicted sulfurtransferase
MNFHTVRFSFRAAPPKIEVLDPKMRRSTEFPQWVDKNIEKLKGKKVLMYCTGGIRCERASAFLKERGLTDVNQCEGGIHKYLEEFEEDGGYWVGANYTFDKRFSHGAKNKEVISKCVICSQPWERYAARRKCKWCKMEIIVCRTCDRGDKAKGDKKVPIPKDKLVCPLCVDPEHRKLNHHGVQG